MTDVIRGTGRRYSKLSLSQALIGWIRFMEGVIYKEMIVIQQEYLYMQGACGTHITPTYWAKGLIVRLIKIINWSVAVSKCACA